MYKSVNLISSDITNNEDKERSDHHNLTRVTSFYEGALKSSRPNNEKKKKKFYNFKIIFIFQHNLP